MKLNETILGYPDDNPKTQFGVEKTPLHLVPPTGIAYAAAAFQEGALKYGPYNWREKTISSSVYYSAMMRHMNKRWDGEDCDPDTGVPHVASAIACLMMIPDAESIGMLNDDRPTMGGAPVVHKQLENIVGQLKDLFAVPQRDGRND